MLYLLLVLMYLNWCPNTISISNELPTLLGYLSSSPFLIGSCCSIFSCLCNILTIKSLFCLSFVQLRLMITTLSSKCFSLNNVKIKILRGYNIFPIVLKLKYREDTALHCPQKEYIYIYKYGICDLIFFRQILPR